MKDSRTPPTPQPSSSKADPSGAAGSSGAVGEPILLTAPRSWRELTQPQLRYVFFLLGRFADPVVVKTYLFFRFTGLRIVRRTADGCFVTLKKSRLSSTPADTPGAADTTGTSADKPSSLIPHLSSKPFYLASWQIQSFLSQFSYVDHPEDMNVRLERIGAFRAVDVLLRDVSFIDYLNMERLWQLFVARHDIAHLQQLACLLYRTPDGDAADITLDPTTQTAVFYWYSFVKEAFARMFPHFFRPAPNPPSLGEGPGVGSSYLAQANIQIRALTDGDVTKEEQVKAISCLRALTELNEKAREAAELRKAQSKK